MAPTSEDFLHSLYHHTHSDSPINGDNYEQRQFLFLTGVRALTERAKDVLAPADHSLADFTK